jgi:adenylate kinase family enzyme
MIKPSHKKIIVFGNAGSGKTTLAKVLHAKFHIPLYHLDRYYWKPGWERTDREQFGKIHRELCERDQWILEGSYPKFLPERVAHADVVVFLDIPRYLCMWRVLKRTILNLGKILSDTPEGCKQKIFDTKFFEFLSWIWNFNKRYRADVLALLKSSEFEHTKQMYILHSPQEMDAFIKQLKNELQ